LQANLELLSEGTLLKLELGSVLLLHVSQRQDQLDKVTLSSIVAFISVIVNDELVPVGDCGEKY